MEDSNSLDLTDSAEDRVHVPIAFTRDHADWLTADGQADFARGTEASVTQSQADAYAAMVMHDTLFVVLLALIPLDLPLCCQMSVRSHPKRTTAMPHWKQRETCLI